jgi:hypothetical protein
MMRSGTPHSLLLNGKTLYMLPRKPTKRLPPFAAIPGFPEVSGEVVVLKAGDWERLTAEGVGRAWSDDISLSAKAFAKLKAQCLKDR